MSQDHWWGVLIVGLIDLIFIKVIWPKESDDAKDE